MMTQKELKAYLVKEGYEASSLDDCVHLAADGLASNANNGGMESQINFLMDTACGFE